MDWKERSLKEKQRPQVGDLVYVHHIGLGYIKEYREDQGIPYMVEFFRESRQCLFFTKKWFENIGNNKRKDKHYPIVE